MKFSKRSYKNLYTSKLKILILKFPVKKAKKIRSDTFVKLEKIIFDKKSKQGHLILTSFITNITTFCMLLSNTAKQCIFMF